MKQRQLGKNGPMISAIGIGAMSFSNFYGATDEAQSHAILSTALDEGVTHIDTANAYGPHTSESVIGTFLARQGKSRNELFSIATKAAITKDPETGARTFNNSAEHLESELDGSLARLGVDHVDLFYVHRRDPSIPIEEVTETLVELNKKDKPSASTIPRSRQPRFPGQMPFIMWPPCSPNIRLPSGFLSLALSRRRPNLARPSSPFLRWEGLC